MSRRNAVLYCAASSNVSGGTSLVFVRPGIDAFAITAIPCYIGFNTQQGAEGVGRATTQAVVATSVTILLLDAVLAQVLLGK